MTEIEKRALLPRLRFSKFRDAKPWSFQPLGTLASRSTRKNADGKITRVLTNSAEYGVVDQREFFNKDIANQGNLEGHYLVEEGSYVYNPRISATAPVGPISKNRSGLGVMSPLYTVFKFKNGNDDFYAYYFKSAHWHRYMRQASSTGARHDRMSITRSDFLALPVPVSTPEEQEKIADCLSSLDDLIAAEIQKLDALKTHKKGLMKQLFPREGETAPRLRFPEFSEVGDWETTQLGVVCNMQSGKFVSASEIAESREEGFFPCYGGNGLRGYTQTFNQSGRHSLIGRQGALCGNVNFVKGDFYATEHAIVTTPKSGIRTGWLFYNLCFLDLNRFSTGQAQPGLSVEVLEKVGCTLPKDEKEQEKIADCLSSLDELIAAETHKLDTLKLQKKGLINQLFPMLAELPT